MFIYLIFSDNFYCTFDVSGPVHSYANLAKTTLAKDTADFVTFFDIGYFFETAKVFEIQDMLIPIPTHKHTIFGSVYERINLL